MRGCICPERANLYPQRLWSQIIDASCKIHSFAKAFTPKVVQDGTIGKPAWATMTFDVPVMEPLSSKKFIPPAEGWFNLGEVQPLKTPEVALTQDTWTYHNGEVVQVPALALPIELNHPHQLGTVTHIHKIKGVSYAH
jgi:hypothetical protein